MNQTRVPGHTEKKDNEMTEDEKKNAKELLEKNKQSKKDI